MTQEYKERIIDYYDNCQVDYELVWHLKTHQCMHYGYWEKGTTKNLRQALNNMNDQVARAGKIVADTDVVDLGCGVGGPAVYIAKRYEARIQGISLSGQQVKQASQLAKQHAIDNVHFIVADYNHTPFEGETFDVGYAIESACYAQDKGTFLKEAFRILRPGGRLVVVDFFWTGKGHSAEDKKLMKDWTDSWAIDDYASEKDFEHQMAAVGFCDIQRSNCNAKVWPSVRRLKYLYYPGMICDMAGRLFGIRRRLHGLNTRSTYLQYKAFKRQLWNYNIYVAGKPVN